MTERGLPIADGAPACPFVAFEDDRDERASSPDHRHRCYAEANPAPRALAHQEAYCLSSAFPVCPTFQDWARREAARARGEGQRPTSSDAAAIASEPVQRNPPRNWAAPPPWMSRGERDGRATDVDWEDDVEEADDAGAAGSDEGAVPARGRGLSGSYADRVAAGADAESMGADFGAAAESGPGPAADAGTLWQADQAAAGAALPARPRHREREMRHAAAVDEPRGAEGPPPAGRPERRRDPAAPEWERPRLLEAYPTLRARRLPELSVPPILVSVIALALAAAVLFALPGLLGFGNPGAVGTPTPSAQPTAAASLPPTPVPEPTLQIYTVQSGDTMSKIAKQFGIPLGDLIAANEANIPDPDKLQIGDQVIIPVPEPDELPPASEIPGAT